MFTNKQCLAKSPILMKEDTSVTVRHIKDVALFKAKRLLPQFVSGLSSATSRALHFQQTIKMMVYAVVFFSQNCGFQAYKLIGPERVRHTDYHILFRITLDGSDRTRKRKCTKVQIFQLAIRELSRMHCLNMFQYGGDVGEGHKDVETNLTHIAKYVENNLNTPDEFEIPVGYINRENFNDDFCENPSEDISRVTASWGAAVGGDLCAINGCFGLSGPRAKMMCSVSPLSWDDLSNPFWFPVVEEGDTDIIRNTFLQLFQRVVGPGGAADKNKERFASVDNLLKNKCTFYTKNDYARFNEQIKRLRNDYLAKLNKERGADFSWETLPQKDKEGCHKWVYEQAASDPIRPHGFSKKLLSCLVWLVLFDPMHANHNHAKYNFCTTLLVAINFVSFFNSLFPDQTRDRELQETDTSKWGVQKESPSFLKIVQVKNLVNDIIETMESERGLNIQANKTKKNNQKIRQKPHSKQVWVAV